MAYSCYQLACVRSPLQSGAVDTYTRYVDMFIRWLEDSCEPGGILKLWAAASLIATVWLCLLAVRYYRLMMDGPPAERRRHERAFGYAAMGSTVGVIIWLVIAVALIAGT